RSVRIHGCIERERDRAYTRREYQRIGEFGEVIDTCGGCSAYGDMHHTGQRGIARSDEIKGHVVAAFKDRIRSHDPRPGGQRGNERRTGETSSFKEHARVQGAVTSIPDR